MNEPKVKVLYAEDDAVSAAYTRAILEAEDFEVKTAANGKAAWKILCEWRPDILLLDLDMPKMDGIALARLIRKQAYPTHITVYTTLSREAKEVEALNAGADDFLKKDSSPEVLVAYMRRIRSRIMKGLEAPHLYQLSSRTTYNSLTRELSIEGQAPIQMPKTDSTFLHLLCAKNNEIAGKQYLIEGIWGKADIKKEIELKKYASHVRTHLKADPSLKIEYRETGYILISLAE